MTIEEKTRLAEWMGKEVHRKGLPFFWSDDGLNQICLADWEPDTLEHFPEVWNKLTGDHKEKIYEILELTIFDDTIALVLNNTPKVLSAILEVIPQKEKV